MKDVVGFVGLGNMGSSMAKNLASSGFSILGYDLDPIKNDESKTDSFETASTIKEIGEKCVTVIVCLPHPDTSQQVIFDELLADASIVKNIIETSTLTPEVVLDFADKLSALDINFLSAPMIGGKNSALDKTILFLVEGDKDLYDRFLVIFQAMGRQAAYVGKAPSATLAKLSFNLSRYANLAVGMETYKLLQAYGANTKAIYEFMSEQSLDNFGQVWKEDLKETMVDNVPFKPSQVPKKDLQLLSEMASANNLDPKLIEAIRDTYLSME
jgi:3-hydroxyisobutyrate dehydrogenase-like beta-hydroxyacid dehydrogenase